MKKKLLAGLATGIFLSVMTGTAMADSFVTSGIFVNPTGAPSLLTDGVGTNFFQWGDGTFFESKPSSLKFTGGTFPVDLLVDEKKMFGLGTFDYFNGTVDAETIADTVVLNISLLFTTQAGSSFKYEPIIPLSLVNTLNVKDDPEVSADSVQLPGFDSVPLFNEGGKDYFLTLGFGKYVEGGGFTTTDGFHVYEGQSASTGLYGSITSDVAPVPEPATMLLFGTGLAGLAGYRNRRKNKA